MFLNKSLFLKYICLPLALVPLVQGVWAEVIYDDEKEHVIRELVDCLKNDAVYMSNIPKYQKIEHIAEKFEQAWELAKKPNQDSREHSVLHKKNQHLWGFVAKTQDRDEFMGYMNQILSSMFSHLAIVDAKEDLAKELSNFQGQLGITYRELDRKSPYQGYIVETVLPGGVASPYVMPKDTFSLSQPSSVTLKYTRLPGNQLRKTFSVRFYRKGRQLERDIVCDLTYPNVEYNCINHYEPDQGFLQALEDWYKSNPILADYLELGINSFAEGIYPGQSTGALFDFAGLHSIQNLLIDLRGNGGGSFRNLNHLLSFFISPNVPYGISVTKDVWNALRADQTCQALVNNADRRQCLVDDFLFRYAVPFLKDRYPELCNFVPLVASTASRPLFTGKVAILIDKNTASVAELFTNTLKDFLGERCQVIGQKSGGALLTTYLPRYASSFKIIHPDKDFLPISGVHIEGRGIRPDRKVRNSQDTETHKRKALEWFRTPSVSPGSIRQAPVVNDGPLLVPQISGPAPIPVLPTNVGPVSVPVVADPIIQPVIRKSFWEIHGYGGTIIDSHWIAFVDYSVPSQLDKVKVASRIYSVNKSVSRGFGKGGTVVMLWHLTTPILEIPKSYNYRYGVEGVRLLLDLPNRSDDFIKVMGAPKEEQDRLYSKDVRKWMDSVVIGDACGLGV